MTHTMVLLMILLFGTIHCRFHDTPLSFTLKDLHLDDITDISELGDTAFLVKRAIDAIKSQNDDAKETKYGYSYKTADYEHSQKGMIKNGELSVIGAYKILHPDGYTQTTMYIADKKGYRAMVQLRYTNLLKSAVG